ncbi:MAG: class I SAM-dependent rRNA methyltransferase [Alphaproteobacteria bacterium]|nr:class I SAM-dependent rRNA methyltransferase [Alphaproteobacteria bacterium]MCB9692134.1 class I SAM-dependent rRNA methyltransferase [Alphaproteobacteria bacterium]
MRSLTVNGYSAKWLGKQFPWVYPKEVVKGAVKAGEWATVREGAGRVLGTGVLDDGWIACRVFRHGDGPVDEAWIHGLLDRSAALRDVVVGPDTDAYRLVNAENDGLPGIRIDWWGHHATIVLDSPSLAVLLPWITGWLEANRSPRGVHLAYRQDPRDERRGALHPEPGVLAGFAPTGDVKVRERGITYGVRPHEGPDVGLYTDMREVRAFLEPTWAGTSVLNTFAYTGAFSVSAAMNGAAETVSVDLSAKYLERAEQNFVFNELSLDTHDFLVEDTFKALDRFRRQGRMFDRIVLDPPSWSHGPEGMWSAKKDMPRLVAAAARVTEPGGWILACSNQGDLSPRDFRGLVLSGLERAGRPAQSLQVASQGPDYPALSTFPEGRYLKVTLWRLL